MRDDADLTTDAGDSPARPSGAFIRHLDLELLSLHVDGALDPPERIDADTHLTSCYACLLDYSELRTTVSLLQGLPQYEPRKSFVLGSEYARVKRRPIETPRPAPAATLPLPTASLPSSRQAPVSGRAAGEPAAPAARSGWYDHLLPSAAALRIASGVVGVALLATVAGDMLTPDPAPIQGLALQPAQVATSILPPGSQGVRSVPAVVPADPAGQPVAGVTETPAPALQQENGSAAAVAADSRPSPWRIAQIGLAMLLLWLIVGLAGRRWVDRHDSLPA